MNVTNLLRSGLRAIQTRTKRKSAQPDEVLIRVSNLTRRTSLGDRIQFAGNPRKRRRGLLGRKQLEGGEGLWIVPCEAVHTFGMQFAIDLVFLDRRNIVRKVRNRVPPRRLSGWLRPRSVPELAAGTLKNTPIHPGDTLQFSPVSHSEAS